MHKTVKAYMMNSRLAALALFASAAVAIFNSPSAASRGAYEGLKICSSIVIPALFPFTAAAVFFQKSGALDWLGYKLNKPSQFILGVSGTEFTAIIISLLGGYPVGAKIADCLYSSHSINKKQAMRLLKFCINPSPAFFISVIGTSLLGSKKAGIILLLSNLIACMLLGFIYGKATKRHQSNADNENHSNISASPKQLALSDALVQSVSEAANIIISICAWVTLFSSVSALIKTLISDTYLNAVISSILEITFGSVEISKIGIMPYMYSLLLSFGGLSTICQIKQASKNINPSFSFIIIHRIIHGAIATVISYLLFYFSPITYEAISNSVEIQFEGFPMFLPSLALLAMAVVFLIYLKPNQANAVNK